MKIPITTNKTKENIILNFILDESGSMQSQRDVVISGFNEYIQTMRSKTDEANYVVNLVKFGDKTEFIFKNKSLNGVREISRSDYNPSYSTALRDAIGNTINLTEGQMSDYHNPTTLFFIFTDGYENASKEYTQEVLKRMIVSREERGNWTFTFIGADAKCLDQARDLGIYAANTISYNPSNFVGTMRAAASSTSSYTSGLSARVRGSNSLFKQAGFDNSRDIDEQVPFSGTLPIDTAGASVTVPIIKTVTTTNGAPEDKK